MKRKSKTQGYALRAAARYLLDNGPSTADNVLMHATMKNGKSLKTSRFNVTTQTLAQLMKIRSKDFYKTKNAVSGEGGTFASEWMVHENSLLLA